MPALTIPAGYVNAAFVHQQNDTLKPAVVTMGLHSVVKADLLDVAQAWNDHMLAEMNNSFTYRQFRASTAAGLLVSDNWNTPGAGGGSGTSPQVTYLIKKGSDLAGRSHQGRMYYPGCDETSVDSDGRVSSGKLTGLAAMLTAWVTAMDAIGVDRVILHVGSSDPDVITSWTPESVVATQRRRLRRGL